MTARDRKKATAGAIRSLVEPQTRRAATGGCEVHHNVASPVPTCHFWCMKLVPWPARQSLSTRRDQRLEDVHQHWHQAEEAYFHPEPFRVAIQAAIQTLRTVTFILQKQKKVIPDFDAWYGGWREKLKADPLMRWMDDARDEIVHRVDLEAHSFLRAEINASYLNEGPSIQLPAHLLDDPLAFIKRIPLGDLLEHIARNGTLRIQRLWVENTVPDYELLPRSGGA
jgi:hypothetical protein